MTSIHDLKLGSNTLEVLETILGSLERFPEDIAKLDLSKFTKIAGDIDKSYQNIQSLGANVTSMKEAISQTKRLIDEIKSQMDNKLNVFNADFLSTKEIKEVILQTQSAINGVKRQIDAIKSGFDSSYADFNTKKEKFDTKSTEVNQNLANFNAKKEDFTSMANEANRQITNLQGMVENATNSLTALLNNVNNAVDTANTKKDNLDASIQTANTTKQELEVIARNTENLVNNAADELKNRISTAVNEKVSSVTGALKNEILTQTDTKINTKANQATTYNKTEVNNLVNAKANANAVVNLDGNQTIAGVKTFSVPPVSATNPTANNQVANKAYVDRVGNSKVAVATYNTDKATFATKTELTNGLNTKANQATTYTKQETNNLLNAKLALTTYNTDKATFATKTELTNGLNTKANQATTYNKTEVNNLVNAKANANAVVNLDGNQTIAGVKTFSVPPVSATNPTANNQVANKAYVDIVGNSKVAVATYNTDKATFATKTELTNGLNTKANQATTYTKKRGGWVTINNSSIDLNSGINFVVNLTKASSISVSNAGNNIGQTGEIYVANGYRIAGFSAPFNFRVDQSGFGANEVFSYVVVSASLVRIVRS